MIDFRDYIAFAEYYTEQAEKTTDEVQQLRLLIPATLLAWFAIECFINNMLDDFSSVPAGMFSLHERAFLQERKLQFQDSGKELGKFIVGGSVYEPLDHKIMFLLAKFKARRRKRLKGGTLWQRFEAFKKLRNALIHPRRRGHLIPTTNQTRKSIETAKSIIQLVSRNVWRRKVDF